MGKSPALEVMRDELLKVLQANPELAPGTCDDEFHLQQAGTHCAATDRLRDTGGYQFVTAAEGGPMLCPSWPTSATWNQSTHINLQRYLDSAYGGAICWENVMDRAIRKKQRQEQVASKTHVPDRRTNVTIALLQQVDILTEWWAAAETKCSVGLPARFVFTFGSSQPPGPPALARFGQEVVLPVVSRIFKLLLSRYGPHAAIAENAGTWSWIYGEAAEAAMYKYRVVCHDVGKSTRFGGMFSSILAKARYWLAHVSLQGALMENVWAAVLGGGDVQRGDGLLSDSALKLAMEFFTNNSW